MAVVVYKCDTCKRDLETIRDIEGLEVIGRCTITLGCRGKLYQVGLFTDYKRGSLPDTVIGLTDWQQRRVLYNHEQPIQNTQWNVVHNLGTVPSVSVFVDRPVEGDEDNREEILPQDITIVSPDVMVLTFDREWSGIAQLVARQSDPQLLQPQTFRVVDTTQASTQISNVGEVTVATKLKDGVEPSAINLQVNYSTTAGVDQVITYVADDQPAANSPWNDVDKVVIKGKVYTVRSYSGVTAEMTTGVIASGSTFRYTGVDEYNTDTYRDIEPGEVYMLLATSPYEIVDKITTQYIDITDVTDTVNQFAFIYDDGEFVSLDNIINTLFPPMHFV